MSKHRRSRKLGSTDGVSTAAQAMEKLAHGFEVINLKSHDRNKITGAQIRAARALLRWSAKDLANAANLGVATVSRAEAEDQIPSITVANLGAIQAALEIAGVEFVAENGGGAGVRFSKPRASE